MVKGVASVDLIWQQRDGERENGGFSRWAYDLLRDGEHIGWLSGGNQRQREFRDNSETNMYRASDKGLSH